MNARKNISALVAIAAAMSFAGAARAVDAQGTAPESDVVLTDGWKFAKNPTHTLAPSAPQCRALARPSPGA